MPVIGAKDVNDMTRREFEELPRREEWNEEIECDSLVILPTRRTHDSGYRCMDFVAVQGSIAFMRLAGGSDVLHIDGIGGLGYRWFERANALPNDLAKTNAWQIDCLKKSGLLRIFPMGARGIIVGASLSSFEIWAAPPERRAGDDPQTNSAEADRNRSRSRRTP